MAECSDSYFEPSYHIMKAIQSINPNAIPFEKYFVQSVSEVPPPKYLNADGLMDMSPVIPGVNVGSLIFIFFDFFFFYFIFIFTYYFEYSLSSKIGSLMINVP